MFGRADTENEIQIRKMTREDVPAVAALEREIFSEPWTERGFREALGQAANRFFVAVDSRESIVGYCGLYVAGDEGEITNVAVAEDARRRGIGERLLTETLAKAESEGVRNLFLEVRASNEPAIRLYKKHGFVPCGTREAYYRCPTEDAVLMGLTRENP